MAKLLKLGANVFMAATLAKLVAEDLTGGFRADAALLARQVRSTVEHCPYIFAGAATAAGIIAGNLILNRRRIARA